MHTNALIHETSPYLLQHAHNPVDWEPWKPAALERAVRENKLVIISIGYAACHWCHVMEHESFEDPEVAGVMNAHFINIKVDREERPDVDQIYMDALQIMTGSGGWPLNIVALPDGRPFWGATYVPKQKWMQILQQLTELYTDEPEKVEAYASDLTKGIKAINTPNPQDVPPVTREELQMAVAAWMKRFDPEYGGYKGAPKFMMPANLDFLLHYYRLYGDEKVLQHLNITLTKMAYGGLFDHIAGGFSRYSVDPRWHVPHFEKMLYDNGQLMRTYSIAYRITGNSFYREVVRDTWRFIKAELGEENGGFYASLDADSLDEAGQLEEGAYYSWSNEELESALGDDFTVFADFFNVNDFGHWEKDRYVLIRSRSNKEIAEKHGIDLVELTKVIQTCKTKLLKLRSKRSRPRLDDKIITSWNAMVLKGLAEASRYLEDSALLEEAKKSAAFIEAYLTRDDDGLYHTIKGEVKQVNGFAEDYAWVIDAYISLYQASLEERWLFRARDLMAYCITHFHDTQSGLFYFTSDTEPDLIRRSFEMEDNVIPASNSILAKALFLLSHYFPGDDYGELYTRIRKNFPEPGRAMGAYSNWMSLHLMELFPFQELVVLGKSHQEVMRTFQREFLPQTLLAGNAIESDIPLYKNRLQEGKTLIYLCENGACQLPEENTENVMKQIISS